jgi:hypothetical protein
MPHDPLNGYSLDAREEGREFFKELFFGADGDEGAGELILIGEVEFW